jgi:hypothetical protein
MKELKPIRKFLQQLFLSECDTGREEIRGILCRLTRTVGQERLEGHGMHPELLK